MYRTQERACAKALRQEKEQSFLGIGGRKDSRTEAKRKCKNERCCGLVFYHIRSYY